ncbi:translation initiation factor IF-2 subunit beta [Candidatus Woesearchaeota archaeon]|nr:translation initiation factor IF-2 subunit beta [Candidatus Woesearchaeota archaeon]
METYERMLEEGIKNVPKSVLNKERFEMPQAKGHVEGNKTIINNFMQIADQFRRKPEHLLKFIQRELATPGILKEGRLILGRKISSSQINEKIERYAKIYVLCRECGKPDTQLLKEDNVAIIKCTACGAKHPAG